MSTTNYVTITNDAIEESGADLATFDTGGADWTSNTNTLMNRMKRYVARAWRDIQQEAFDWGFLEEIAVVNVNPGVMFYTGGSPVTLFTASPIDIFDQDGSTAISQIPTTGYHDLTGISTDTKPFGYFDVTTTASAPITWSLKPGAEYFAVYTPTSYDTVHGTSYTGAGLLGYVNNVSNFTPILDSNHALIVTVTVSGVDYNITLTAFSQTGITYEYNSASGAVVVDAASITNAPFVMKIGGTIVGSFTGFSNTAIGNTNSGMFTSSPISKAYVHGWKSFNFSEETGTDDFQEDIKELDQKSFRIIDYFKEPATGEVPIEYVPWEAFARLYDISSAPPGIPRVITRDNTNRFRLYPHPYYIFTLKFDYTRTPQEISAYNDVFKGLDEDYKDIVMWKALIYYGEFDEQPSVAARATKNYKNFLTRLEQLYRQKFHLSPKRLY